MPQPNLNKYTLWVQFMKLIKLGLTTVLLPLLP